MHLRPWPSIVSTAFLAGLLAAQQEPAPAQPTPSQPAPALVPKEAAGQGVEQLAKAMTVTMRLSTPGEEHARLCRLAGDYEVRMTLSPPGIPPQECRGEAKAMAALSGRYLLVNLKVRIQGVVLEGLYILGYDRLRDLYTVSWRDSMSTWAVDCSGPKPAESGAAIALQGTMVDAASPTGRAFELELALQDDGFAVAVKDQVGDRLFEVMRQRFVRKKPDAAQASQAAPDEPSTAGSRDR